MNDDQKFHVTYEVKAHPEGLTAEGVAKLNGDVGACDAVMIVSIVLPPDGSCSQMICSTNGKEGGREMTATEMWKAWVLLAGQLAEDPSLTENKRELCREVFDVVVVQIRETRGLVQ